MKSVLAITAVALVCLIIYSSLMWLIWSEQEFSIGEKRYGIDGQELQEKIRFGGPLRVKIMWSLGLFVVCMVGPLFMFWKRTKK